MGHLRVNKGLAEKLCKCPVFPRPKLKAAKDQLGTPATYLRRCISLGIERSQALILRSGGGSDIGFTCKETDNDAVRAKVYHWHGFLAHVQTLLQSL